MKFIESGHNSFGLELNDGFVSVFVTWCGYRDDPDIQKTEVYVGS